MCITVACENSLFVVLFKKSTRLKFTYLTVQAPDIIEIAIETYETYRYIIFSPFYLK